MGTHMTSRLVELINVYGRAPTQAPEGIIKGGFLLGTHMTSRLVELIKVYGRAPTRAPDGIIKGGFLVGTHMTSRLVEFINVYGRAPTRAPGGVHPLCFNFHLTYKRVQQLGLRFVSFCVCVVYPPAHCVAPLLVHSSAYVFSYLYSFLHLLCPGTTCCPHSHGCDCLAVSALTFTALTHTLTREALHACWP